MPVDASIIDAISSAVGADPNNLSLRSHLASLLVENGEFAGAKEHCAFVLAQEPDNVEALRHAKAAAAGLGDAATAQRYGRLLKALEVPEPDAAQNARLPDPEVRSGEIDHPRTPGSQDDRSLPGQGEVPIKRVALKLVAATGDETVLESEDPGITLADVAGLEEVKRRLNLAFLAPMRNPEVMKMYGKSLTGGLMLYGPPGCGKTFVARAVAGELGARFVSVGLSDVLDMWLGNSERNLHEIFEAARREAPTVLFFDEIDALGRKRSLMRHSAGSNVINVMLAEMDGMNRNNKGVFVLAATNHPWDVDSALRRPGRFDRTLLVLPPDKPAREAIFRYHLKDRPVDSIDIGWLADRTEEFSGADVAHLCESAAELAIEESLAAGTAKPIGTMHFKRALTDIKPSIRSWLDLARNYAMFANEGGVYDDLLRYLRTRKLL